MKYTHAILGGSGHIGTAITDILLKKGQKPLVIGHDPDKINDGKAIHYEVADVLDTEKLSELFGQAERLFILNPPAPPNSDTDKVERAQICSILDAIDGRPFKKIVAASTYGAHRAEHLYDLGTLYDLEQGLAELNLPLAVIRSAYYMSNFDQTIPSVRQRGELVTLFPKDLKLPMVAPADIGELAAALLTDDRTGLFFTEGPETYSNQDAAFYLSDLLNQEINVITIPENEWTSFLENGGFSKESAESFSNMIRLTMSEPGTPENVQRGKTTLYQYLKNALVRTPMSEG